MDAAGPVYELGGKVEVLQKRAKFWTIMTVIMCLCAFCVSCLFINSVKSVWIALIAGATGALAALVKIGVSGCKLSAARVLENKRNYLLLTILSIVICSTIALFLTWQAALCFIFGCILTVKINAFKALFQDDKNIQNALNTLSVSAVLFAITLFVIIFNDAQPIFSFAFGSVIASIFGAKNANNAMSEGLCLLTTSAVAVGALALNLMGAFLPLVLGSFAIYIMLSSLSLPSRITNALVKTLFFTLLSFLLIYLWLAKIGGLSFFYAILAGVLAAIIIIFLSKLKWESLKYFLQGIFVCATIVLAFLTGYGMASYPLGIYGIILSAIGAFYTALFFSNGKGVMGTFSTLAPFLALVVMSSKDELELFNPFNLTALLFGVILAALLCENTQKTTHPAYTVISTLLAIIVPVALGVFINLEIVLAALLGAIAYAIYIAPRGGNLAQIRLMVIAAMVFLALFKI